MIRIRLEDKKVSLKTDVDPELPDKLYGDEGRIKQILINLLNNAVMFTNQGEITFTMGFSKMSEDRIRLLISVTEWNNKKKELDSSFAAEDWQTYKIVIHAMKSTSKMIGADGLSNGARELEIAAID